MTEFKKWAIAFGIVVGVLGGWLLLAYLLNLFITAFPALAWVIPLGSIIIGLTILVRRVL